MSIYTLAEKIAEIMESEDYEGILESLENEPKAILESLEDYEGLECRIARAEIIKLL